LKVVPGAHLQVPGVSDESELEELAPERLSDVLVGCDGLGVPGEFGSRPVLEDSREAIYQVDGDGVRIGSMKARQGGSDARAPGLGYVNEEDLVARGQKHGPTRKNSVTMGPS
jgi:hypothetical protein